MATDEQLLQEKLFQDDVQARIDALDVTRSFIVQAPAGSGKTELLIQRYLNLLAIVEHPEEIVAITFTRKAAAEMQLRVLRALRGARNADAPQEKHERKTYALAQRALTRSDQQQWSLISNPRRMRILTLDALNASIARAQPLRLTGSGFSVLVGAQLQAIYRGAAFATLDWLAETGDMQAVTVEVLQHVDNNTTDYVAYLSQMLATRDQWLPFVGSGFLSPEEATLLRQRFELSLEFSVSEHLKATTTGLSHGVYADLCELLDYAATNMHDSGETTSAICTLKGIVRLPQADPREISLWRGIAEALVTKSGGVRKKVDKRQGFPPGDKAKKDAMHTLLERLADDVDLAEYLGGISSLPPLHYSDEQWQVLLALFRLLPLAVGELKRLFNEQGVCDHVDIALMAGAALGNAENPGDLALLLDYRISHLLVDEMQDTSAAQYRMLETLTGGWQPDDGRTLYCVGDPMQSIYRFRNAEVGQFLLARECGIGNIRLQTLVLRRNFRSGEGLVSWFNAVFPTIFAATDDPLRGAVSYSEAVPVEHLMGQGSCVTHAVFGADVRVEAQQGCRVIAATLRQYADDDMAVLVRARTQLPQLLGELRTAGISYRALEIDRLTDLPEIIEVLSLTRAAAHQGDRMAWLGILRAPWIGLHWSDLHALVRNDAGSTVWELLNNDQRMQTLSSEGRQAIERARGSLQLLGAPRRSESLRGLVEGVWFALGGPGVLSDDYAVENVYRYFEVLSSLERAGTLMDVGELEATLDLERVSNNDNARLHIMTMHRAKGLQFDHVILYGLGRQPGSGERSVLSWVDLPGKNGEARSIVSPVGRRSDVEKDPIYLYIEQSKSQKDRNEQARLLYVACTRARKTLHLMGNTEVSSDGQSCKPPKSNSLLRFLWPALDADFSKQIAAQKLPAATSQASPWVRPERRQFAAPWVLPPVEHLQGDATAGEDPDNSAVEFYWVGNDARIAGTLVHRWLQIFADNQTQVRPRSDQRREITSRWLRESGLSGDAAKSVLARVDSAVTSMLGDEKGLWILDGPGYAELKLTAVIEGNLVSVIMDRVRIDASDTHWVIDYKSGSHEGGDLRGFVQAEVSRYRQQLERYAFIYRKWSGAEVRCALYFPLLREFVEVPV